MCFLTQILFPHAPHSMMREMVCKKIFDLDFFPFQILQHPFIIEWGGVGGSEFFTGKMTSQNRQIGPFFLAKHAWFPISHWTASVLR